MSPSAADQARSSCASAQIEPDALGALVAANRLHTAVAPVTTVLDPAERDSLVLPTVGVDSDGANLDRSGHPMGAFQGMGPQPGSQPVFGVVVKATWIIRESRRSAVIVETGEDPVGRPRQKVGDNLVWQPHLVDLGQGVTVTDRGEIRAEEHLSPAGSAEELMYGGTPVAGWIGARAEEHIRELECHGHRLIDPRPARMGKNETDFREVDRRTVDPDGVTALAREQAAGRCGCRKRLCRTFGGG
jgi:hypothetical protein